MEFNDTQVNVIFSDIVHRNFKPAEINASWNAALDAATTDMLPDVLSDATHALFDL